MRKLVLCLLVLAMLPLTVATASVNVDADVSVAAVNCSGSCGGGRTWSWTCPAGWDCWLNCTKNPPTWCWKPATGEEQVGTVTTVAEVPAEVTADVTTVRN